MDAKKIQPALKQYLDKVRATVHISSAFIFGSVAEGKAKNTSDVDLIVLSDDFAKLDPDDRAKILYRASSGFPYDLHVHGFTTQEFRQASPLTSLGQLRRNKLLELL